MLEFAFLEMKNFLLCLENSLSMNNWYILSAYYEPGTIPTTLHMLTHLSLQTTLSSRQNYDAHFSDDEN